MKKTIVIALLSMIFNQNIHARTFISDSDNIDRAELIILAEEDIFREQARRLDEKYDSTMKSLEQKCSKGNIKSCLTRGKFHLYSYGNTAMHENKALEFFQKACQKNNADGCAYIAYLEKDENKSFKLYEQACDKGSSLACAFYAAHFSPKVFSYNPDITRKAAKAQYSKDLFNILYKACLLQDPDDYTLQHSIIENEKYEYHFLDKIEHRFCRQAKYHKEMVEKNSIPLVDIDL